MEIIETDVAIIGGGAAGLRAAIAAAEHNPEIKIAVVSKVYPVRSHTVSAEGGIAGVLRDYDSLESHISDTIRGGDYLADQDAVEFLVKQAPREIIQLEHWGCPWSREEDGKIAVRAFGGMSVKRTVYAADKTGFYMLHNLFERTLKHENIVRYDEWFVTKLFCDNGRATGFYAIDLRSGKHAVFRAKAIIMATGGAGQIFSSTTNSVIKTGDGMALALRAGAPLKDMEFVQFHPTGLPRTGILITESARGEGGYLLNKNGERFMKRYLPNKMELGPRDIISRSIMSEIKAGRGFDGPHGAYVHLDIRHLGRKKIGKRLPLVCEIAREFACIDPVNEPIPVRPVCHYFMGGIHTNIHTETPVAGLFAAGETACITVDGANRLGSNSLTQCVVFGKVAGEQAAEYAAIPEEKIEPSDGNIADEENRLKHLSTKEGPERVSIVRESLQRSMQEHAWIERNGSSLQKGLEDIECLRARFAQISLGDRSQLFNTEFTALLELDNMLDVARAVTASALAREETRGAHFRTDFTERDDSKFLKHHLITKRGSDMIIKDHPVTITKWQLKERKY